MHRQLSVKLRPLLLQDCLYLAPRCPHILRGPLPAFSIRSIVVTGVPSPPRQYISKQYISSSHSTFYNSKSHYSKSYSTNKMAATDATMRTFFTSPNFAVVGASTNPDKWGYKVFKWYVTRKLLVTPINPTAKSIKVNNEELSTLPSISALENPKETSLSIITAPPITLKTLKEAKDLGIPSVWLQPGTFDDEVLSFARENFKAVVAGEGGHGSEGWCVLVDGDRGLQGLGQKL